MLLGVVTLVAAVLSAVAVVISSNHAQAQPQVVPLATSAQMQQVLAAIPQHGDTLGSPSAPVTVTEFADLQCPYCHAYTVTLFPYIVQDYVVPGKVKLVWRGLSVIGPDSSVAGRAALAASEQDKLWNFADAFYYRQRRENSGYVTAKFLRRVASTVPGLNVSTLMQARTAPSTASPMRAALALAKASGVTGTPAFVITRAGRRPVRVIGFNELTRELNRALTR